MSTGGEAADQMVRMMLSGSEAVIRLSGSALKNTLALTVALAKQNKRLSGFRAQLDEKRTLVPTVDRGKKRARAR